MHLPGINRIGAVSDWQCTLELIANNRRSQIGPQKESK
jgi:hypothetical protein